MAPIEITQIKAWRTFGGALTRRARDNIKGYCTYKMPSSTVRNFEKRLASDCGFEKGDRRDNSGELHQNIQNACHTQRESTGGDNLTDGSFQQPATTNGSGGDTQIKTNHIGWIQEYRCNLQWAFGKHHQRRNWFFVSGNLEPGEETWGFWTVPSVASICVGGQTVNVKNYYPVSFACKLRGGLEKLAKYRDLQLVFRTWLATPTGR